MHVPFPLQCWDVIAKLRGYNNIAKGRGKTKGGRIFQCVSRFLSKIVAISKKRVDSINKLKLLMVKRGRIMEGLTFSGQILVVMLYYDLEGELIM